MEYAIVKAKAVVAGREVSDYARQALLSAEVAGHENPGKDLPTYRLSVGEFARILILKSEVKATVTPEQIKLFKDFGVEVRNIGINLNRLAKAVNAGVPKDYAAEILKKRIMYKNECSRQMIINTIKRAGITDDEILRFYFGNYINEPKGKRILDKLASDLFNQDEYM
jgi:hypothetical protein